MGFVLMVLMIIMRNLSSSILLFIVSFTSNAGIVLEPYCAQYLGHLDASKTVTVEMDVVTYETPFSNSFKLGSIKLSKEGCQRIGGNAKVDVDPIYGTREFYFSSKKSWRGQEGSWSFEFDYKDIVSEQDYEVHQVVESDWEGVPFHDQEFIEFIPPKLQILVRFKVTHTEDVLDSRLRD